MLKDITDNKKQSIIIPEQLRLAREDLALDFEEVVTKLGIQKEQLISWERGLSEPSLEQLSRLAEFYCRDIDYFLSPVGGLPKELTFRLPQKRTIRELSLDVRRVLVQFDELCRAEKELEMLLEKPRKIEIKRIAKKLNPDDLANQERQRLGLGDKPIKDLRKLLTEQGIRVFALPVPENEFSGVSWWHQDYGPCILANANDIQSRRNFTLAHEYAHILVSDPPTLCGPHLSILDIAEDSFASQFAAAFLMPAYDLIKQFELKGLSASPSAEELSILAWRYGVSLEAIGRRLESLRLIHRGMTDRLITLGKVKLKIRAPKGPKWQYQLQRQLGAYYIGLALQAYKEGLISIGKLAQYLQLDIIDAREIAKSGFLISA